MVEPAAGGKVSGPRALAALAGAAALAAYLASDPGYQVFIDKYPVDRFTFDNVAPHGPTSAIREPTLSLLFDWRIDWRPHSDRLRVMDPKSVLVYGDQIQRMRRDYGVLLETGSKERLLVILGDQLLSTFGNETRNGWQEDVMWLFSQFSRIACQAKDFPVLYVSTAPMGIGELYLRGDNWKAAKSAIDAASLERKPRILLCPPGLHFQSEWLSTLPESHAAVVASRKTAIVWALSSGAPDVERDVRTVPASHWWSELSLYRFVLAPHGLAVQTTKTIEALLVLTVPIVQRATAHEDLIFMGFPLLMVDAWDNITRQLLKESWARLSPRLQSFRSHCLTAASYWKLYVGEISHCY